MDKKSHINKERLLDLYVSFINSFDGSPTAFKSAWPIMERIFHPTSFALLTGDGPKDFTWYKDFCKSFAESGNVARVTSIEPTEAGFRVTIKNRVSGVDIDPITFNGTVLMEERENCNIVHFAPVTVDSSKHIENVGKMVQLVDECANNAKIGVDDDDEMLHCNIWQYGMAQRRRSSVATAA